MSVRIPNRTSLPAVALSLAMAGSLAACGATAPDGSDAPSTPVSTASVPSAPASSSSVPLIVNAVQDPDNTLIAHVTVSAPTATGVVLTVTSAETAPREILAQDAAASHEFTVVGLRADTEYTFEASIPDAPAGDAATTSMTTGALPGNAPRAEVVRTAGDAGENPTAGITFFGLTAPGSYEDPTDMPDGPIFWGVDPQGAVVWYLNSDKTTNRAPLIRTAGDGTLLAFFKDTIDQVTLDGEVLKTYDMSAVPGWHHDAYLLPDGGLLALGAETRKFDGQDVHGDLVVELDAEGQVVSTWALLDHLDPDRFPGELSNALASAGGLDWSHSNSVLFDEDNGEVVVSVRSQGWVIAYDRATGDLSWIAGDDSMTAPGFDAPFLELEEGTWTSGQHAATFTEDGELFIFDNRNETGGAENNSRAVAYEIDRDALTARQVFEAVDPKYSEALGDVDQLADGTILSTAGGAGSDETARITEVLESGEVRWDLAVADTRIYRSERMPWSEVDEAA